MPLSIQTTPALIGIRTTPGKMEIETTEVVFVMFVGLTRWLWQVVGVGWLEQRDGQVGSRVDVTGPFLEEAETRTIQHQLLVMILWLVLATGTLYLLV